MGPALIPWFNAGHAVCGIICAIYVLYDVLLKVVNMWSIK